MGFGVGRGGGNRDRSSSDGSVDERSGQVRESARGAIAFMSLVNGSDPRQLRSFLIRKTR